MFLRERASKERPLVAAVQGHMFQEADTEPKLASWFGLPWASQRSLKAAYRCSRVNIDTAIRRKSHVPGKVWASWRQPGPEPL